MARIKHIAIRTPDPEKTAAFYRDVFGLKEVGQARTGYYLSDGYINLAILKAKDEGSPESPRDAAGYAGVHHFGFMVDDVDETCRKLDDAGARPMTNRTDTHHAPASALVLRDQVPRARRSGARRHRERLDHRRAMRHRAPASSPARVRFGRRRATASASGPGCPGSSRSPSSGDCGS